MHLFCRGIGSVSSDIKKNPAAVQWPLVSRSTLDTWLKKSSEDVEAGRSVAATGSYAIVQPPMTMPLHDAAEKGELRAPLGPGCEREETQARAVRLRASPADSLVEEVAATEAPEGAEQVSNGAESHLVSATHAAQQRG